MIKTQMTKDQANEMYYTINSYYVFLRAAENIDKSVFARLKFFNPIMNQHLKRARQSVHALMAEFNKRFKSVETDVLDYDAPAELYEAVEYLSRLHPEEIAKKLLLMRKEDK